MAVVGLLTVVPELLKAAEDDAAATDATLRRLARAGLVEQVAAEALFRECRVAAGAHGD